MKNILRIRRLSQPFKIILFIIFFVSWNFIKVNTAHAQGGTYSWTGTSSTLWTDPANWSPNRSSVNSFDVLQFTNGAYNYITNIPNQQNKSFIVTNNTTVSLNTSSSNTLTLTDVTNALYIQTGSRLVKDSGSVNILSIIIGNGSKGFCEGIMDFESSASGQNLFAADASGFSFKAGSECIQNNAGNTFGSSGTANTIIFESGSKFTQRKGSNPFGLAAPSSKVVFNHGSLFSMQQNAAPSFSGRTYGNLEINSAAFSQSAIGGSALSIDSIILTSATLLGLNLTGGITVNGNINIKSGTLNLIPASANTISLTGINAFVYNAGTFVIGPNATLNNTNSAFSSSGTLTVNGILNAGGNNLIGSGALSALTGSGTIKLSGSIASQVTGYNSNTFSGTYEFTGSNQSIPLGTYSNLKINGSGTTLGGDAIITGALTLTSGILTLGSNTLTIASGGSISGGSITSYVKTNTSGGLKIASMTSGSGVNFPIGNSDYDPVIINYTGATRDWTVSVSDAITSGSIGVNPTAKVNREWNIVPSSLVGISANLTLQWNTSDEDTGFNEANPLNIAHYDAGTGNWSSYSSSPTAQGTAGATSHITSVNGLTQFSPFAVANDGPLPVELTSFSSQVFGRDVKLSWSTNSEINNSGFEIERKAVSGVQWNKVIFVSGAGNSNVIHSYLFTERNLLTGNYNYRLKQIDFNGTYKYYDLINEIIIGVPQQFNLSQNYPNPFNPTTKIKYDLPFDSKVTLKIYDMTGREVTSLVNNTQIAGYFVVDFNASNLASGMYIYNLSVEGDAKNFVISKKMILMK